MLSNINDTLKLAFFMIVDLVNNFAIAHRHSLIVQSPLVTALLESIDQCL